MKLVFSKSIGYCLGVEKTLENAEKCILLAKEKNLSRYSIGNLIHNEHVVKCFSEKGLQVINAAENHKSGIALIRAHGISEKIRRDFSKSSFVLLDSTCPNIVRTLNLMKEAFASKRKIIVVGLNGHDETATLMGAEADGKVIADFEINNIDQANKLCSELAETEKISIFVQTTFSEKIFDEIVKPFKQKFSDLVIENTFCPQCIKRKTEALQLAKTCNAVLVIGSRTSANTKELASHISDVNNKVYLVQDSEDLDSELVSHLRNLDRIGVCSGTSTPEYVIDEVVKTLSSST